MIPSHPLDPSLPIILSGKKKAKEKKEESAQNSKR